MNILTISYSKVMSISKLWTISDWSKWLIFIISGIILLLSVSQNIGCPYDTFKNRIEYFLICSCVAGVIFLVSAIILMSPELYNINSFKTFAHPYTEGSDYTPVTVIKKYKRTTRQYNQRLSLYKYDKRVLRHKRSSELRSNYYYNFYQKHAYYDSIACTKLGYQANKYANYLNELPNKDIQKPSWWMYI